MLNGSKNKYPLNSTAAHLRQPVMRGEIERLFQGVETSYATNDRLEAESGQVAPYDACVKQVQEMDRHVLDCIRALRSMHTRLDSQSFEPLSALRNFDRKGV